MPSVINQDEDKRRTLSQARQGRAPISSAPLVHAALLPSDPTNPSLATATRLCPLVQSVSNYMTACLLAPRGPRGQSVLRQYSCQGVGLFFILKRTIHVEDRLHIE